MNCSLVLFYSSQLADLTKRPAISLHAELPAVQGYLDCLCNTILLAMVIVNNLKARKRAERDYFDSLY